MDRLKQKEFKRLLLKEREQINNLTDALEYNGLDHSLLDATGELSSYDNHPADHGDITFERGKDIALRDNNATLLSMIDDALEKIDQGSYGMCDHCGKEIPEERLRAFPYTTMCIDCKEHEEQFDEPRHRPLEEEFLNPPFSRTFTDESENVVFDGEDTWQAVAQYGTSNGPAYTPSTVTDPQEAYEDADEEQGIVDWGDAIPDDGFVEEYQDDEHTGVVTRPEREEYWRKD